MENPEDICNNENLDIRIVSNKTLEKFRLTIEIASHYKSFKIFYTMRLIS